MRMMSSAKVPKKIKIIVSWVLICKICRLSMASLSYKVTSPQKRLSTIFCTHLRAVKLTSSFRMVLQTSLDSTKLTSIYRLSCFRLLSRSRRRCSTRVGLSALSSLGWRTCRICTKWWNKFSEMSMWLSRRAPEAPQLSRLWWVWASTPQAKWWCPRASPW